MRSSRGNWGPLALEIAEWAIFAPEKREGQYASEREDIMECKAIRSSPYTVTVLLVVGLLRCGSVVGAPSSGVDHTPVTSQELPHNPGRSLTAIMGALAP